MSGTLALRTQVPDGVRAGLVLAVGWLTLLGGASGSFERVEHGVHPFSESLATVLTLAEWAVVNRTTFLLLVFGSMSLPLVALGRWVARARVRAGLPNPVDVSRAWTTAHPWALRSAAILPALYWAFGATRTIYWYTTWIPWHVLALPAAVFGCAFQLPAFALLYRLALAGLRTAVAPMRGETHCPAVATDERIAFDAVAVTPHNVTAIALVGLLPLATLASITVGHLDLRGALFALGAQALCAGWAATAFLRRSKVALGVDGIYVTGTRLRRFYAYKDLDAPRSRAADVLLSANGKTILRLQLYGDDAWLRDTVLGRIAAAVRAAKEGATDGAAHVLSAASDDDLARIAQGRGDYRTAHVTREQLWQVLAHPSHDGKVRVQAARALANAPRPGDQERLLATAARCTEPGLRLKLLRLADPGDGEAGEDAEVPGAFVAPSLQRPHRQLLRRLDEET